MRGALLISDPGRATTFRVITAVGPGLVRVIIRADTGCYTMSMKFISIEQEALHLPLQQRARLVYRLLASLDDLSESEVEQLWLVEAQRRADEIDQGLAKLVSAKELDQSVQSFLK